PRLPKRTHWQRPSSFSALKRHIIIAKRIRASAPSFCRCTRTHTRLASGFPWKRVLLVQYDPTYLSVILSEATDLEGSGGSRFFSFLRLARSAKKRGGASCAGCMLYGETHPPCSLSFSSFCLLWGF